MTSFFESLKDVEENNLPSNGIFEINGMLPLALDFLLLIKPPIINGVLFATRMKDSTLLLLIVGASIFA